MRADLIVKGKSLTGSSDLTLLAPLKRGLVPSLEAVTYKTRTQRLLRLLNGGRTSSHEFSLQRPLSDSVERVARIHSVRVVVFEPEDKVMLAVTFDGTWEAYIRVLWQKVGTLLDAIFCNTEDYVLSREGFEAWCGWVNRVQAETGFFFNTHALTVGDVHYLREHERIHRSEPDPVVASLVAVRASCRTAEEIAYEVGQTTTLHAVDTLRQGLQALALLFRMTDLYLPGTPDGDVLLRAARDLLMEFCRLVEDPNLPVPIDELIRERFDRQLTWLRAAAQPELTRPRPVPPLPAQSPIKQLADVQGGMLAGYDDVTHGCLLLLAFDNAKVGAELLAELRPLVTNAAQATPRDGASPLAMTHAGPGPFYNVAVTFEGLRRLGMSEAELAAWLPQEFREGMEARASMLGDFRANHPRRWPLPHTNWNAPADAAPIEVQMSAVHMIVQLRAQAPKGNTIDDLNNTEHVLHGPIKQLIEGGDGELRPGLRVLSVQPMQRLRNPAGRVMEHFGFADGEGQPEFTAGAPNPAYPNQVHIGELLLGYANEADAAPAAHTPDDAKRLDFLHNGSFMVVRKLRQDVPKLRAAVRKAVADTGLSGAEILEKMMGRRQDGSSLIPPPGAAPNAPPALVNDFNFDADPEGSRCPFHAHVRRANPRSTRLGQGEPPGRRRARIVRRGMAYGPKADVLPGDPKDDGTDPGDEVDRGLVFIAYNASIGEQFEVVQRWISGGNSTGGFSGHSDPFLGVPEPGQQRYYRFEATTAKGKARPFSIALDSGPAQFEEPEPYVRLQWGAYLFVPSMSTLDWLQARAEKGWPQQPAWQADEGQRTIDRLERVLAEQGDAAARDAWKSAIEDPQAQEQLHSASLWAAVRERHGGALRTPYGVLVASGALINDVLGDDRRFSVCGYRERMIASRFDIYLGLDHGSRYEALSKEVNKAIGEITKADAFKLAADTATATLQSLMDGERAFAMGIESSRWELNLDAREVIDRVQQVLCQEWLGLPPDENRLLQPGSWRWDWTEDQASVYPSHFTPPSRYFFQPRPGEDVRRYGERYAAALSAALEAFVAHHRSKDTVPQAPQAGGEARLAQAILAALPKEDNATVGRIFAGVLMGFLPTLDGNLRLVLNEWLRLQTLWSLRAAWATDARPMGLEKAEALLEPALMQAMQFRPSPELIWRTAQSDSDRIGNVPIKRGDVIVLALVSATHEALAENRLDVMPVFGGKRRLEPPPRSQPQPRHPTHACPGYHAAMGVMLGVLAAFVDVKETLRPSPAPLAFTLEGTIEVEEQK